MRQAIITIVGAMTIFSIVFVIDLLTKSQPEKPPKPPEKTRLYNIQDSVDIVHFCDGWIVGDTLATREDYYNYRYVLTRIKRTERGSYLFVEYRLKRHGPEIIDPITAWRFWLNAAAEYRIKVAAKEEQWETIK